MKPAKGWSASGGKVLFVSYFFPPIGGVGVIRLTKFAKYLRRFGWEPYVLTVKKGFYPLKDKSLLKDLPSEVKITRISYFEPGFWFPWRLWRSFLAYFLYPLILIPDNQILWFLPALIRAYRLIKKEKIKLIFTSAASYSDHLIALILKKLTGVTWVADFRDEWLMKGWQKNILRLLEREILDKADKVITISDGLTSIYQKILGKGVGKFITITNGFDEEDFETLPSVAALRNTNLYKYTKKKFKIIHTGLLYGNRSADIFLEAFNELQLKNAELEFVGIGKRFSHQEAIIKMLDADVLLLILSPQDGPAVMTGKIFEYLAARKPILAIAPDNSGAARLVRRLKIGEVAFPLDKEEIKSKILKMYQLWQKNHLKVSSFDIGKYERKFLTGQLAKIFEKCLEPLKLIIIGNLASPQNQLLVKNLLKFPLKIKFFSTQKVNFKKIEVFYLGRSSFTPCSTACYFLKTALKVRKLVKQLKPDIIHGQDLVFAGIWAYLSGLKRVGVTVWGSDVINFKHFIWLERLLIRRTLKKASLVTGPAWHLRRRCQQIGLPSENYELVHFGVDPSQFYPKNVLNLRQKYLHQRIIFCPRKIAPIYNTDILIEAFLKIQKKIPSHLILLDKNADEKYLIQIEKMLIQANLLDKVTILPELNPSQMNNYFNLAEVVVSLASSDGCPNSFLEALATGSKMVVTNLPFTHEWPGTKFWRVPVRNVQATAKTLKAALKYPQNRWQKPSRKNREIVLRGADAFSHAQKLFNLYESLR